MSEFLEGYQAILAQRERLAWAARDGLAIQALRVKQHTCRVRIVRATISSGLRVLAARLMPQNASMAAMEQ